MSALFPVDMRSPLALLELEQLHLDHEQDARVTCDLWQCALPPTPSRWDDGVNRGLICHLRFSLRESEAHGPPGIPFHCGPPPVHESRGYCLCHLLNLPHYEHGVRSVEMSPPSPNKVRVSSAA